MRFSRNPSFAGALATPIDLFQKPGGFILVFLLSLMNLLPSEGQPMTGDRFLFHQEMITTGTVCLERVPCEPLTQSLDIFGKASVLESTPATGMVLCYTFDRLLLKTTIEHQGTLELEVLPGKVVLDGTPVYDRERNPDIPVGLLDLMINEEILVYLDAGFHLQEIRQFRRNRSKRTFFDLLSVVRSTLIPPPPEGVEVGDAWVVVRPMESLGGDFLLPATNTFRYNEASGPDHPVRVLQEQVVSHLERPRQIPIRMGILTTENLRFDALGPNLIAPPPNMILTQFDYESKGVLQFNTDWGFAQQVGTIAEIHLKSKVPPPDGIELRKKSLRLRRKTLITIEKAPEIPLTQEEKALWLRAFDKQARSSASKQG